MAKRRAYVYYLIISILISIVYVIPAEFETEMFFFFNKSLRYPIYWALGGIIYLCVRIRNTKLSLVGALLFLSYNLLLSPQSSGIAFNKEPIFQNFISIVLLSGIIIILNSSKIENFRIKTMIRSIVMLSPVFALYYVSINYPSYITDTISMKLSVESFQIPLVFLMGIYLPLSFISIRRRVKKKERFLYYMVLFVTLPIFAMTIVPPESKVHTIFGNEYIIYLYGGMSLIFLHALMATFWQRMYIDELTGIKNRRALEEKLTDLHEQFIITMIDIDFFKKFNDKYGHDEGDNVLRLVASLIDKYSNGKGYRYGGEEFCLVFENTTVESATMIIEKIRSKIANRKFYLRNSKRDPQRPPSLKKQGTNTVNEIVQVTISAGVSTGSKLYSYIDDVFKEADEALYAAKNAGRNNIKINGHSDNMIVSHHSDFT